MASERKPIGHRRENTIWPNSLKSCAHGYVDDRATAKEHERGFRCFDQRLQAWLNGMVWYHSTSALWGMASHVRPAWNAITWGASMRLASAAMSRR